MNPIRYICLQQTADIYACAIGSDIGSGIIIIHLIRCNGLKAHPIERDASCPTSAAVFPLIKP